MSSCIQRVGVSPPGFSDMGSSSKGRNRRPEDPMESKIRWLRLGQKAIQGLALALLVTILLIQTGRCIRKYFDDPTFISTLIVEQRKAEFPAMTVCPQSDGYKPEVLKEHGVPDVRHYNWKRDHVWSSNQTGVSAHDLFLLATHRKQDVFKKLYIRTFLASATSGSSSFHIDLKASAAAADNSIFTEQRHRMFGRCYTIHPEKWLRDLGVYYMKLQFHIDTKIYLHRHGQFLDLNGRMGYKVNLGQRFEFQIGYEDIRMLPKHEDGSIGGSCTRCVYDDCMYSAVTDIMMDKVGCTVPWVPDSHSRGICSRPQDMNSSFWIVWNRITNQHLDCQIPCQALIVSVGAKNVIDVPKKPYGEVLFYFAPRVKLSQENYFYTFLSLMAEIGGYVGLLLGVSLFHFAGWLSALLEKQIKKYEVVMSTNSVRRVASAGAGGSAGRDAGF